MENQDYVTREELAELGIILDDSEATSLIEHINNTIEERVGVEIINMLDDDQLEVMSRLEESSSEDDLGEWIEANIPEYAEIIQDNIDIVVGEIAEQRESIS